MTKSIDSEGGSLWDGWSEYFDHPRVRNGQNSKIYVPIVPGNFDGEVLALLDTGADWSTLRSEVARELHLIHGSGERIRYSTRVGLIEGTLERVSLRASVVSTWAYAKTAEHAEFAEVWPRLQGRCLW